METKKTTVDAQILAGNLGDGWADNNLAAHALADFMRSVWESDLRELQAAAEDVEFAIEVKENTEGYSGDMTVDGPLADEIEPLLTDEKRIWELFCKSPEAKALWADAE